MIKSIIFDFDGTLVNTNDVIIEAWRIHTDITDKMKNRLNI